MLMTASVYDAACGGLKELVADAHERLPDLLMPLSLVPLSYAFRCMAVKRMLETNLYIGEILVRVQSMFVICLFAFILTS